MEKKYIVKKNWLLVVGLIGLLLVACGNEEVTENDEDNADKFTMSVLPEDDDTLVEETNEKQKLDSSMLDEEEKENYIRNNSYMYSKAIGWLTNDKTNRTHMLNTKNYYLEFVSETCFEEYCRRKLTEPENVDIVSEKLIYEHKYPVFNDRGGTDVEVEEDFVNTYDEYVASMNDGIYYPELVFNGGSNKLCLENADSSTFVNKDEAIKALYNLLSVGNINGMELTVVDVSNSDNACATWIFGDVVYKVTFDKEMKIETLISSECSSQDVNNDNEDETEAEESLQQGPEDYKVARFENFTLEGIESAPEIWNIMDKAVVKQFYDFAMTLSPDIQYVYLMGTDNERVLDGISYTGGKRYSFYAELTDEGINFYDAKVEDSNYE